MIYPDLRDRPLFICGHPKSGTSLMRALLDGHPQLVAYPEETVFFRRFVSKAEGKAFDQQLALADEYLIHIFAWNQQQPPASQAGFPDRDYASISFDRIRSEFRRLLAEYPPRHLGDLLSAAVAAYGIVASQLSENTSLWVEKSPYNEHYAARIFDWWPQARCLHLVRDPRDNYLSYRRKHPDWQPEFFARNWVRSTRAGFDNFRKYGRSRYFILRYEDLVETPESSLRQLCAFLAIDYLPQLTSPARAGDAWAGNSMFGQQFDAINPAPVGRWQDHLEPDESGIIETMAAPLMRRLGYSCPDSFPLRQRVRAAFWPLRRTLDQKFKGKIP